MTTRALRVAFIGTGQMARHHLRIVQRLPVPAVVVGVHDRAPAPAEEFARLAATRAFRSRDELLAESRPDLVHVCTPPATHGEAAYAALEAGAHVYVEKPFAVTVRDARMLLDLARSRGRLVCAGHQLLRDPAFEALVARGVELGTPVQADSHFAFRPVGPAATRTGAQALAAQAVDILPHPLYTLIALLDRFAPVPGPIEVAWAHAGPGDLQAILQTGDLVGRLSVSLRARPVASWLTLVGTGGSLTCDFVRSIVVGAANPGTEMLEKVLNPMVEGLQLLTRTPVSVGRRMRSGVGYPGLAELITAFYRAVATGSASPVSPEHLLRVTSVFERLVAEIDAAARRHAPAGRQRLPVAAPLAVVTGARGFLGAEIARSLPRVRGLGRAADLDDTNVDEWVVTDLSVGLPAGALDGADVVVHAAAETAGGYEAHQRNTVDATRNLLRAMHDAGVSRLVLVSSLSVLRPPRTPWERQDERTPRPSDPRALGPYVWGKCMQEELVEREAPALGIATRIIRPGALLDWNDPALPGLMGRRLFGRWHLGLGRPKLPIAVCDVRRCAEAIAWCATHFEEAPAVVNLIDPALTTRGALAARLRADGWTGRVAWVPISVLASALTTARAGLALAHGRRPGRFAAWSILRPRRYDARLATALLDAVARDADAVPAALVTVPA
ncbi:MAG: NAD-dependent epimerase/dehydratase family protein [Candidatus Rokuibacteriota bacterium]|nr:MAG: NAD-dependent epimerase/dehydratase family protein [Candidatus Rokubacteria bacterium]